MWQHFSGYFSYNAFTKIKYYNFCINFNMHTILKYTIKALGEIFSVN